MVQSHSVTTVLLPGEDLTEARLAAFFDDTWECITLELNGKEILRMDYENFAEWSDLIKAHQARIEAQPK